MEQPLFRLEVLDARRKGWLGGISLAQPLRLWILAAVVVAAAAAIGVFLVLGSYTRRSRVVGHLVPDLGLSTVVAPTAGIVGRIYPREGQHVLAGARLALVSIPRATEGGTDARDRVAESIEKRRASLHDSARSQAGLFDAREHGLRTQLAAMQLEAARVEDQLGSRARQVALGRETLERYQRLRRQQYLSATQLAQQQQQLLALVAARQSLQRQLATLQRDRAAIDQALQEIPAQRAAQAAATARELALLDNEQVQNQAGSELLVESPVAGLVADRLIEPGQSVQAGQPLLTLLPAGSHLQAELFVPTRAVGFIKAGDQVLLRYRAFPYQKFGHQEGVVSRVSRSVVAPAGGGGQGGEPYYRVFVDIEQQSITAYGRQEALRPGMMLDADILGEHRKLYEWVLDPLYSISGRLK